MTNANSMPAFKVLVNRSEIGTVYAVSFAQGMIRAAKLAAQAGHRRFELIAVGNVPLDRKARASRVSDMSYSRGRAPYATPGFEARRAALIAAHKAGE